MPTRLFSTLLLASLMIGFGACTSKTAGVSESVTQTEPGPRGGPNSPTSPGAPGSSQDPRGGDQPTAPTDDSPSAPEPVPEPGTILLFGTGLTGLALVRRRRREKKA